MGRRFLVLVGCIAAVLVTAVPTTANNKPTTGARISIFGGPATFAADTPFNIEHGLRCALPDVSDCTNAQSHFDLYLDGVLQPSTVDIDNLGDGFLLKSNLTNYPAGLSAGSRTFVGVFVVNGTVLGTVTRTITFT